MLSFPVPRALYSFTKGFNGRLAIRTSLAPVEPGTPGKYQPLSLISKEISSVSSHAQQESFYPSQTPLPLRHAGIRWNPLFASELRERIASVKCLRSSTNGLSQTGSEGVSHNPDPDPASTRCEAWASLAKDDGPQVGKMPTSFTGQAKEAMKPEAAKAISSAASPAYRPMPTMDFAPLTSPGLVLAQQRAFDRSMAIRASVTGTASAAAVPSARELTRPLAMHGAVVHSRAMPLTMERNSTAKPILRSWSDEKLRDAKRIAKVEWVLSSIRTLCQAADERTRAINDPRLAIDLSRTFGDRFFSPQEVRVWRRDIAAMSEYARRFSQERDALVGFTHLNHKSIRVEDRPSSAINPFSEFRNDNLALIITDAYLEEGEAHAMLQTMRAIAQGAERRDTLVFPLTHNQDPVALVTSPHGALRELDAFCEAGIRLHGKLLSGQADADIDRVAVRFGKDLPKGLVDRPLDKDATKEGLKALQRDDRLIEAIIKSNCDSLVQYVLRCAISPARLNQNARHRVAS